MKHGLKLFWMGDEPFTPIPSDELYKIIDALNKLGYETKFYLDRLLIEKQVSLFKENKHNLGNFVQKK